MDDSSRKDEFISVIESLYPYVLGIVKKFHFDECTRMEIVQEIVFRIYRELDSFTAEAELKAWIHTAARNYCIMYKERIYKRYPIPVCSFGTGCDSTFSDTDGAFINKELKKALLRHIHKLPYNLKTAMVPYYLYELGQSEIPEYPVDTGSRIKDSADNLLRNQIKTN